jgi:hypothetical protein
MAMRPSRELDPLERDVHFCKSPVDAVATSTAIDLRRYTYE